MVNNENSGAEQCRPVGKQLVLWVGAVNSQGHSHVHACGCPSECLEGRELYKQGIGKEWCELVTGTEQ